MIHVKVEIHEHEYSSFSGPFLVASFEQTLVGLEGTTTFLRECADALDQMKLSTNVKKETS